MFGLWTQTPGLSKRSQGIGSPDHTLLLWLMLHYQNIFLRLFPWCPKVLSLLAWIIWSLKHYNSHLLIVYHLWIFLSEWHFYSLKEVVSMPGSQTGLECSILWGSLCPSGNCSLSVSAASPPCSNCLWKSLAWICRWSFVNKNSCMELVDGLPVAFQST